MRYWVYINGEVPGSFAAQELTALPGFSQTTLVCPADGEIQQKNWRRAGEFPELAAACQSRQAAAAPAAPLAAPSASDISALLDNTGARLISHVSELMKQLESTRENQSLIQGLQRQVAALTMDLKLEREKASAAQEKARRFDQLQAQAQRDGERLRELEAAGRRREQELLELHAEVERLSASCEAARQDGRRAEDERAAQKRLADKLSRELAERDASLTKAVSVVRRLEETLLPAEPSGLAEPASVAAPSEPAVAVPLEEPPPAPPLLDIPSLPPDPALLVPPAPPPPPVPPIPPVPPAKPPPAAPPVEAGAAQKALIQAFKRLFAKDLHS